MLPAMNNMAVIMSRLVLLSGGIRWTFFSTTPKRRQWKAMHRDARMGVSTGDFFSLEDSMMDAVRHGFEILKITSSHDTSPGH